MVDGRLRRQIGKAACDGLPQKRPGRRHCAGATGTTGPVEPSELYSMPTGCHIGSAHGFGAFVRGL